jgi:CHAT domain-containing protein
MKKLEKEALDLEKALMQASSAFREEQSDARVKIEDLQEKMNDDEAVIEFVRFDYYDNRWTDTVMYAAYVLRNKQPVPVFIPLFEESQLQALFDSAGSTAVEQANSFYRGLKKKNDNAGVIGEKLYQLVWKPLEKELEGVKAISYSPAGLLYNIALHAIPVDSQTLLLDRYSFSQFTSTRLIAKRKVDQLNKDSIDIVLFGDPVFDLVKTGQADTATVTSYGRRGGKDKWDALPGTASEVRTIDQLFRQYGKSSSFTGVSATELAFKGLHQRSPGFLHIATHGFFLPAPEKRKKDAAVSLGNSYSSAENPLMRSGLVFAGANYAWSGKQVEAGKEDGIATAYEISHLDLSRTELVVLSACETALGDVRGSEGVFGLQRGFKMAGVKKMIVSLWQVPDQETAELMTAFYSYWLKGDPIKAAFARAQADMRVKYSPFYWAAFVLVE